MKLVYEFVILAFQPDVGQTNMQFQCIIIIRFIGVYLIRKYIFDRMKLNYYYLLKNMLNTSRTYSKHFRNLLNMCSFNSLQHNLLNRV